MVFELLGASFVTALISSGGSGLAMLNTDRALTIIISIFLSVAIAFVFGLIVQWISRIIFTFHYRKNLGRKIGKPVVVEEFGMPRDNMDFHKGSSVECRDIYYTFVFDLIVKSKQEGGVFAGCNFWSWGGYAQTNVEDHEYWAKGDDYTGDPAQEQQGLNSIFVEDESTMTIIRNTNKVLGNIAE